MTLKIESVPPFCSPPLFSSPETNQLPIIDSAGDQIVPECICKSICSCTICMLKSKLLASPTLCVGED